MNSDKNMDFDSMINTLIVSDSDSSSSKDAIEKMMKIAKIQKSRTDGLAGKIDDYSKVARDYNGDRIEQNSIVNEPSDSAAEVKWTTPGLATAYPAGHIHSPHQKEESIRLIISIREKLSDFLDGSNVLLQILDPQTIRETVKELRWDIREIKKNMDILEIDVIEYQEKTYGRRREEEEFIDDVPF